MSEASPPPPPPSPSPALETPIVEPGADTRPIPSDEERLMGMLIHLLAAVVGWIAPLVLWLVKRKESAFIDHHGKEALNFQITFFLFEMTLAGMGVAIAFLTEAWIFMIIVPVLMGITTIIAIVIEVITSFKAHKGQWARYPVCIRLIR